MEGEEQMVKLNKNIKKAHNLDSGLDLYPLGSGKIQPGKFAKIETGYKIEKWPKPIPVSSDAIAVVEANIRGRSGLASKGVFAHFGTIDNGYTGDLSVVIYNMSDKPFKYSPKKAVAQLVFNTILIPITKQIDYQSHEVREAQGFGSSDRKDK